LLPRDADGDTIETVSDLLQACRVDSEQATASVQKDEDGIKEVIRKTWSFQQVNFVAEQALWKEMLRVLDTNANTKESLAEIQDDASLPNLLRTPLTCHRQTCSLKAYSLSRP